MDPAAFFDALADVPNFRSSALADIEIKDGGNVYLFDGYSTPYNDPVDLGDFTEEVRTGAFDEVLASGANVPMLHEHNPRELLATTKSGRLKLDTDGRGLRVRAKLVKTDLSSRIKALADSGDITGMSTGWVVGSPKNHRFELRAGGKPHRTILNFKQLLDVSTTWNPAYPTTEAQFRSKAMQYANSPDDWQRLLLGAYPQLAEPGQNGGDRDREDGGELRSTEQTDEDAPSRVADEQRLAAAKRRMQFALLLTGDHDAS